MIGLVRQIKDGGIIYEDDWYSYDYGRDIFPFSRAQVPFREGPFHLCRRTAQKCNTACQIDAEIRSFQEKSGITGGTPNRSPKCESTYLNLKSSKISALILIFRKETSQTYCSKYLQYIRFTQRKIQGGFPKITFINFVKEN